MIRIFKNFLRNESGAALLEFTLILMLLISTTFAVVDISYAMWQWNSAEKATQMGIRTAVVSTPIADGLENFDCNNSNTLLGTGCDDPNASTFGIVVCTGATLTCTGGYNFSTAEATRLLSRIQKVFPRARGANLIVEYEDLQLAFAGRGSPVASVTVRLVDMTFEFVVLGIFIGGGSIAMPDFRATLTTEDIRSTG